MGKKGLTGLLLRFLLVYCALNILLIGAVFMIFWYGLAMGVTVPADYVQEMVEEAVPKIGTAKKVGPQMFPEECTFGVYSGNGTYLYGNFGEKEREKAWNAWLKGEKSAGFQNFYRTVERDGGEICVVRYPMLADFADPVLRKYLPNAELLEYLSMTGMFLLTTAGMAAHLGRRLRRELDSLKEVTEKIQNQDLNFERRNSGLREIDGVLEALFDMKEELKRSLLEQWEMEEQKKRQAAALAHDIKTPLTVIRGNAELIAEAGSAEEAVQYNSFVIESAGQIEEYLKRLQEMLRTSGSCPDGGKEAPGCEPPADLFGFLDRLAGWAEVLGKQKNLAVLAETEEIRDIRTEAGENALWRIFSNIISNAAEYTPEDGTIIIHARPGKEDTVEITVTDSGPGFSARDLKYGTEQFYQGDQSRHKRDHSGLGLYIAGSIAARSGGTLSLENAGPEGGAVVRVVLRRAFSPCEPGKNPI